MPAGAEGPETLGDLVGTEDGELARTEARLVLVPLVRSLKERDREILELRFFHGLTQQEIGDRIGVSRMQVSRLLARILARLRPGLGEDASPCAEQPIEASPLPWSGTAG